MTLAETVDEALETAQIVENILRDDDLTEAEQQELIDAVLEG